VLLLLLFGERGKSAQQVPFRAGLQIRLVWLAVTYGDQNIQGQGVFLRGEPLVFEVGVMNPYQGPLAGAEIDWPQRISGYLRPGGRFDSFSSTALPLQCAPQSIRSEGMRRLDDYLELESGGSHVIRCRADPTALGLSGGRYTVTVEWSDISGTDKFRERERDVNGPSQLSGVVEFEYREVQTENDELDLLNHLAYHAYIGGQVDDALRLLERVLGRRPSSTMALILRGRIRAAQGLCALANADRERLGSVIEGNLDLENQSNARLSADERRAAARNWREQARSMKCE